MPLFSYFHSVWCPNQLGTRQAESPACSHSCGWQLDGPPLAVASSHPFTSVLSNARHLPLLVPRGLNTLLFKRSQLSLLQLLKSCRGFLFWRAQSAGPQSHQPASSRFSWPNMGRKNPAWALLYFQVPMELVCLIKALNPQPIEGKESIWWCVHLYLWFSDRQHGDNILLVMPWLVTAAYSRDVLSIFILGEPGLAANVSHHFFMVDNIPEATDKMERFKEQPFETQTWKRSSVQLRCVADVSLSPGYNAGSKTTWAFRRCPRKMFTCWLYVHERSTWCGNPFVTQYSKHFLRRKVGK